MIYQSEYNRYEWFLCEESCPILLFQESCFASWGVTSQGRDGKSVIQSFSPAFDGLVNSICQWKQEDSITLFDYKGCAVVALEESQIMARYFDEYKMLVSLWASDYSDEIIESLLADSDNFSWNYNFDVHWSDKSMVLFDITEDVTENQNIYPFEITPGDYAAETAEYRPEQEGRILLHRFRSRG